MKETKNIAYKFRLKLNPKQIKTFSEWCKTAKFIYNTALDYSEKRYEIFRKHHSYSISLCPIGDKEELKKSKKKYRESLTNLPKYNTKSFDLEIFQNHPKDFHKIPQFNAFATAKEFTEINKIIEPIRKQRVFENSIKGFYKYKNEEEIISYLQKIKEKIKTRPYLSQFFDLLVFLEKEKSQDSENFKKGIRKVRLIKIGAIKFIQHKPILGKIKNVTVSQESKDWYISFCCEVPIESIKIQNKPKSWNGYGNCKNDCFGR